jgi:hypothetical protein
LGSRKPVSATLVWRHHIRQKWPTSTKSKLGPFPLADIPKWGDGVRWDLAGILRL